MMYSTTRTSRCNHSRNLSSRLRQFFHSSSNTCHYKTLGLRVSADHKEIRAAYVQMAKKFHPDVNKSDQNATAKFSSINEAYAVLSDKGKRQQYDTRSRSSSSWSNVHHQQHQQPQQQAHQHDSHDNNNNARKSNRNWWDFNFYGHTKSTSHTQSNADDNDNYDTYDAYGDFETVRDFYDLNNRKRKRAEHTTTQEQHEQQQQHHQSSQSNPYADYYYYQQLHSEQRKPKESRYSNMWSDFEFDPHLEQEFHSEFNNDAFLRFLRNSQQSKKQKHKHKHTAEHEHDDSKPHKRIQQKHNINNKHKHNTDGETAKTSKSKAKAKAKQPKQQQQQQKHQHRVSVHDIEIDLELAFLDAVNGCVKNISFERREICNHCGGTSFEPQRESSKCLKCDGKGVIIGYGSDFVTHKCPNCYGRGIVFKNCGACKGKSTLSVARALTITIPSGIRANDRVRVSKQGHQYLTPSGHGHREQRRSVAKYGHVWIACKLARHDYFDRVGNDIHVTMSIPYCLAVLGGSFAVPTIRGPNILKVLPGINHHDYEVMKGKGIYDSSTNKTGDQLVRFSIHVPKEREISEEQKRLLNEYAKIETPPTPIQSTTRLNTKEVKKRGQRITSYQFEDDAFGFEGGNIHYGIDTEGGGEEEQDRETDTEYDDDDDGDGDGDDQDDYELNESDTDDELSDVL